MKKFVFVVMASFCLTFIACGNRTDSGKRYCDSDSICQTDTDSVVVDSVFAE